VWNEKHADAKSFLALDDADLLRQLEHRFALERGEIALASRPRAFPLGFSFARRFVGARLALIGDAAHNVHPLAGQGLNLGMRDAASLAGRVAAQMRIGLDPGMPEVLNDYERSRRFDVAVNGLGMDAMNRLFSNDLGSVRLLRDFGLRLVDRAPSLKCLFAEEAGGASANAPRLLRGEAI